MHAVLYCTTQLDKFAKEKLGDCYNHSHHFEVIMNEEKYSHWQDAAEAIKLDPQDFLDVYYPNLRKDNGPDKLFAQFVSSGLTLCAGTM